MVTFRLKGDSAMLILHLILVPICARHTCKEERVDKTTMGRGTSCKEAIAIWEANEGKDVGPASATDVRLCPIVHQKSPIEKMDQTLSTLRCVEILRLSTNQIDRISGLSSALTNLRVLSLGRNQIRDLRGTDAVASSLEELWISHNQIERLVGIEKLLKLKVLYMSNNKIDKMAEVERLAELPHLKNLVLLNNPVEQRHSKDKTWRPQVLQRLPGLVRLDGILCSGEVETESNE